MWIVDDDGDMFNTDHYHSIKYDDSFTYIQLHYGRDPFMYDLFGLSHDLTEEERLKRYYDLVEKLTGERIDG
jgi:hypothetical protein